MGTGLGCQKWFPCPGLIISLHDLLPASQAHLLQTATVVADECCASKCGWNSYENAKFSTVKAAERVQLFPVPNQAFTCLPTSSTSNSTAEENRTMGMADPKLFVIMLLCKIFKLALSRTSGKFLNSSHLKHWLPSTLYIFILTFRSVSADPIALAADQDDPGQKLLQVTTQLQPPKVGLTFCSHTCNSICQGSCFSRSFRWCCINLHAEKADKFGISGSETEYSGHRHSALGSINDFTELWKNGRWVNTRHPCEV